MAALEEQQASFLREKHIAYFVYSLQRLPAAYESQDVNRLTLVYFCVAALDLLDSLDQVRAERSHRTAALPNFFPENRSLLRGRTNNALY